MTDENKKEFERKIDFINKVVEKGYSPETAEALWTNKTKRENIENDPTLTKKERQEAIKATRKSDKEIIKEDQKEVLKAEYAMHLFKEIDRYEKRIKNAKTKKEKEALEKEAQKFTEENAAYMQEARKKIEELQKPNDNSKDLSQNTKQTKILKLSNDKMRQRIEQNKEKTKKQGKAKTVKLTPNYSNQDKDNKTKTIDLYSLSQRKLRA